MGHPRPRHSSRLISVVILTTMATATGQSVKREDSREITIHPGEDVSRIVALSPEGTTFRLAKGLYRGQEITPKAGDRFIGEPGTILNGSQLLAFERLEFRWKAGNQSQHLPVHGRCDANHPMCANSEDLFFDDRPLLRVSSLDEIRPGRWYFDYAASAIWIAEDPTGHKVETSVQQSAFSGPAANVTIEHLTVEKYATPAQRSAVGDRDGGSGWIIRGNEVRLNHGRGITASSDSTIEDNFVHDNGQMGIGLAFARDVVIRKNEISSNNYAGFDLSWEAGGLKCFTINGLKIERNKVHDNRGPGLWTDTDNVKVIFDGNLVYRNASAGIQDEISFDTIIRNNTVWNNGSAGFAWLWGSQILIQNSQNANVYDNTVVVAADAGNGIGIIQQNRGRSEKQGVAYLARDNTIHDNRIIYFPGSKGQSGLVADFLPELAYSPQNQGNHFDSNSYYANRTDAKLWNWNTQSMTLAEFRRVGQELHGKIGTIFPRDLLRELLTK